MTDADSRFMRRAVDLSRNGFPAPNPRVGCVIVLDGKVVGEGWHDHAGGDHAEVAALRAAGTSANGADLFCTLEPCDHYGRTPPCTNAILDAKIARVVYAVNDPNPVASGGGETLSENGVVVEAGICREEAEATNCVYLDSKRNRRPFVVGKSAQTLDGYIARADGTSKWITGDEARAEGHKLRAELGCVLVGRATVELDDPLLTARLPGVVNQPLRAILDPQASLSAAAKVFAEEGECVRFVAEGSSTMDADIELPLGPNGFDLKEVLACLGELGVIGVLVEGGGETLASFARSELIDRYEIFVSPEEFGKGRFWLGENPPYLRLSLVAEQQLGRDLWRTFLPEREQS